MAYKRLFIDSDILLDIILNRSPFNFYTRILLLESSNRKLSLFTSALIIANINYVLTKKFDKLVARQKIKDLIIAIKILPFESDDINSALESPFTDFEDAIQFNIAKKHHCDVIITRNIKDYIQSTIPVSTAEQFLKTL